MSVLMITYDLDQPSRNYNGLIERIKKYNYCHALGSVWFIDTQSSPHDVRDYLAQTLDQGDQLYVFHLRKNWGAHKNDQATAWLQSTSRSWD